MKIGVAGLGRMGAAIAKRLIECGHDVTVWNRSPGKAARCRRSWRCRSVICAGRGLAMAVRIR